MARYQHFIACWLALLVFLSSVGVNAYAGYCTCRGQNFISFLYKNQCCKHEDTPKCCLSAGKICTKADFELEKKQLKKKNCCQTESFYSNVSTEIDKLPTFSFSPYKLAFILPKFSFSYKNYAQQFFYRIKVKIDEIQTDFVNWLPPPSPAGRKLLNFCQVYRC